MARPFQFRLRTIFWLVALVAVASLVGPPVLRHLVTTGQTGYSKWAMVLAAAIVGPLMCAWGSSKDCGEATGRLLLLVGLALSLFALLALALRPQVD
ncbi:MAG: hypothetical protein WD278_20690 [Pirellulales bacterium]